MVGFVLTSCEKDIELELQRKGGRLVLFSFLSPDSALNVHLSKTVSYFSVDDFERIYEGHIKIEKNDEIIDSFVFPFSETWTSRGELNFSEGDHVRVEGSDVDGEKVFGETIVPESVPFSLTPRDAYSIKFLESDNGGEIFRCKLNISDPAGIENYYQLIIFEDICIISEGDTICERSRVNFSKNDPVFYVRNQEGSLIGGLDFNGCFSDFLFDGDDYDLSLDLPAEYGTAPNNPGATRKLLFILISHTRDYFDYYRSRVVAEYGYDLPVIDPVRIYNNIEGGLGLVSAYSMRKDSLVFNGD